MSAAAFKHHGFNMADIRAKRPTRRRAVAVGEFLPGPAAYRRVAERTLPKGDAIILAEIAGLQAAKNASNLMPLCHPLPLELVNVYCLPVPERHAVRVYCEVATTCKTGVEMEALAGVSGALLTLYDLTKPVEPSLQMSGIHLLFKEGGKSGLYVSPLGMSDAEIEQFKPQKDHDAAGRAAQVITLSDRAASGDYTDRSGPALVSELRRLNFTVGDALVLADDKSALLDALNSLVQERVSLVVCTGGTGLSARDITPDVLDEMQGRVIAGFGEKMRADGLNETTMSPLSRSMAKQVGDTLIIAVPGSSRGAVSSLRSVTDALIHTLELIGRD